MKTKMSDGASLAGSKIKSMAGGAKDSSLLAGAVISEKASGAKAGAAALKQKMVEK